MVCMYCYDRKIFGQDTTIWSLRLQKKSKYEKIAFKVVQMKLAMHITNQKLSFIYLL